ncbi:MAG TPA: hypothetical protein VK914_05685 [bacterium]|jgi:hypothetical protein|nr:hypothetical protein [bacterium]
MLDYGQVAVAGIVGGIFGGGVTLILRKFRNEAGPTPLETPKPGGMSIHKLAVACVIFSGLVTIFASLANWAGGSMWSLIDVCIIFGFGFGLFKKILWSSVLLSIYWTWNFFTFSLAHSKGLGLFVAAFIGVVYWLESFDLYRNGPQS